MGVSFQAEKKLEIICMTTISSVDKGCLFSGLQIDHRVTTHPRIPEEP